MCVPLNLSFVSLICVAPGTEPKRVEEKAFPSLYSTAEWG